MSHIVTIQTEVRDLKALQTACQRLSLRRPRQGCFELFAGAVEGTGVRLPGWVYPVVFDLQSGQVHYDHYKGHWGDPAQLGRLLQAYAVEKARQEARAQGYRTQEQTLVDGSIRLVVHLEH